MADKDTQRFDEVFSKWEERLRQEETTASSEKGLLRECYKAWESGKKETQLKILYFVGHARPPGGEELVWEGIQSADESIVAEGLAAALGYVRRGETETSAIAASTLKRLVDDEDSSNRWIALHILGRANADGLDAWLRSHAEDDSSEEIRREANIILMRTGDDTAKAALLADIRLHPGNFGVADDLWLSRDKLTWAADEERELRDTIGRYMEWLRGRLRDPDENENTQEMAVAMIGGFVRDGFPIEEGDAGLVGAFARSVSDLSYRLEAVKTLAALNTSASRRVLENLAEGDQAVEVKQAARRALS